jgi:hypothetical protein
MRNFRRWPDACVTAQDWNGRTLDVIELNGDLARMQHRIGVAKRTLMDRYGGSLNCRTFVNVYC